MTADSLGSGPWAPEAPFPVALAQREPPASLGRWNEWKESTKADLEALRARVTDSVLDVAACELEDLLDRMDHPYRGLEAEAQRLGPRIRWRPDPAARLQAPPPPPPAKGARLMLLHSDDLRSAQVARALEQALHARGLEHSTRELYPELGAFFQGFWRGLPARCAASGFDFNDVLAFDRIHNDGRLLGVVNRLGARSLSPRMRQQLMESAAVVTCDPFAGQFLSYLRRVYSVPVAHHAVVLDHAVPALLYPAGCDVWYVAGAQLRSRLLALGEPEGAVRDLGVPVARELEGIPSKAASPREVLVAGRLAPGAFPMKSLLEALRARGVPDCKVVYACAKGEDVEVPGPGVQVIWYSDQLPLLLKRASIAIIPPDGVSLAEALAAGACPILTPPRGEAERANVRFAESAGVGLSARTAAEAWEHAEWLLRDTEELAVRASRCLKLGAPDAARQIAAHLARAEHPQGAEDGLALGG